MKQPKVFIVLSHKNSLKKGSKTEWEVSETVEFVNQIRNKHVQSSSAIADYIGKKMISGARYGMTDYNKFEEYLFTKYPQQMKELGSVYRSLQIEEDATEVFADAFGNIRARTVFDPVA